VRNTSILNMSRFHLISTTMFQPTDKIYPASESSEKNELPPVVSGWKHDFHPRCSRLYCLLCH